jgi:hypothetical protein
MPNKVEFSGHFLTVFSTLSDEEQELIKQFVYYFEDHGLKTFKGKKGPTDNVPTNDPKRAEKIAYAKRFHLWHVHIGYPRWNENRNILVPYKTSNYVVHFQKFSESYIALVDYNSHNPMGMPPKTSLFRR